MTHMDMHPDLLTYPIEDATRAEVEKKYVPCGDQKEGQLLLNPGEIVWVLEEVNGWCGGHKEGDDYTGWFPASVIRRLPRGDCGDDEEGRKSSALYTSDHRAVASPQVMHRKVSAAQTELVEMKQHLETAELERARLDEQAKALSKKNADLEQEKQRLAKKCEEFQTKVRAVQDEGRRKEEELKSQKEHCRSLEETLRSEKARTQSLEGKLKQLEEHRNSLEAAVQRTEKIKDDAGGMSKSTSGLRDGHRTPSVPHATPSGSLQAPPAPCVTSMTSLSQVPSAPLSARQASGLGSRHASPRHGAWMPPMSIPGSPNLRQRVPSQRDLSENAHGVNAQGVHALVNKFEKRSTSYGAAARDTSGNLVYTTATSGATSSIYTVRPASTMPVLSSNHVSMTSVRAGSREAPLQVSRTRVVAPSGSRSSFQVDEPETPNARLAQDISGTIDLSPFKGQPRACTVTRGPVYQQATYSPPSRSTVQDQIRKLEASRR